MNKALHTKYKFADAWLHEATKILCTRYRELGYKIPDIRVVYGFTTNGYPKSKKKIYYGECLARIWSNDNENIIIITPYTLDEIDVLSTLGHEIAHAIDNCTSLHGSTFKKIMKDFGYLYDKNMEFPSWRLLSEFYSVAQDLGKFPSISLAFPRA